MKMSNTPWGISHLGNMIASRSYTTRYGQTVHAVPVPYPKNWREQIRATWWVLTGRAEAVVWPEPGELERALSGEFECGRVDSDA